MHRFFTRSVGSICVAAGAWLLLAGLYGIAEVSAHGHALVLLGVFVGPALAGGILFSGGMGLLWRRRFALPVFGVLLALSVIRWLANWKYVFPIRPFQFARADSLQTLVGAIWAQQQFAFVVAAAVCAAVAFADLRTMNGAHANSEPLAR